MQTIDRRFWLITYNNPPEDWKTALTSLGGKWQVGQLEQGEAGTKHIQGLIYFPERITNKYWTGKAVYAKAIAKDTAQTVLAYVTKEETRLEGPYRNGKIHIERPLGQQKLAKDYGAALNSAKEGRLKEIDPSILIPHVGNLQKVRGLYQAPYDHWTTRGVYVFGEPGTGKSTWVRDFISSYFKFWGEPIPDSFQGTLYSKPQNIWWDGYDDELFVECQDLDLNGVHLSHNWKIWLDKFGFIGQRKGSYCYPSYIYFFITANYTPKMLFADLILVIAFERRCYFVHFVAFRTSRNVDPHTYLPVGIDSGQYDLPYKYLIYYTMVNNK